MKTVKDILEKGKRIPGEKIHLVHNVSDGEYILRKRNTIEVIALHATADKSAIRKALTKLRRMSLAEIMVIAPLEDQEEIIDLYRYGMNILIPPIYKPEIAVAYFNSFIDRHRLLPGISQMKEAVHIKDNAKMQCGDLIIDPSCLTVELCGRKIDLTTLEFKLLYFFAQHESIVFSQDQLYESVWRPATVLRSDLSSRISRLRKKIEPNPNKPTYIRTKWGAGYYFISK
ncbi:winged helix-turn-helix domain-containing protein [Ruminococcaceae bacterium OttesenSCG-928-L11]|nr:winged helix-turn-helix domain-containing protein [Ruminococcaceae bacterium OttesenSCG-928-L11]